MALSFDDTKPHFAKNAKKEKIEDQKLTIYYDYQCPYIFQNIEKIKTYCKTENIPASFIQVNSLHIAKNLPCVFNNWALFYQGNFKTVNILDVNSIKRVLDKK